VERHGLGFATGNDAADFLRISGLCVRDDLGGHDGRNPE
jgi:hypothetical protein